MIRVRLMRSGLHGKHFRYNHKCKGTFIKEFKTIEDLVLYIRSQYMSVLFAPDDNLTAEQRQLFIQKYKSMAHRSYDQIDAKIDKEVQRRRKMGRVW